MKRIGILSVLVAVPVYVGCVVLLPAQQLQRMVATEKGIIRDAEPAHPLSWWTHSLLRLDTRQDLMLGFKAPDGKPVTLSDYPIDQKVTTVGTIAGRRIVQILSFIHAGPRVVAAGFAEPGQEPAVWKDLLVDPGGGHTLLEIYALHFDVPGLVNVGTAQIYGSGSNAILGTYDPDTGNGGGCWDGYWWFDERGPHEVDFSPLIKAVSRAIPEKTTFTHNCWALHPKTDELESGVQRIDAECHACGFVGTVHATFRIQRGVAEPVSTTFTPEE